jgi:hypothetical protein
MANNPPHFHSIVISELYNENVHGIDEMTDPNIYFHYIVADRFSADEFYLYNKKDGDDDHDEDNEIINTLIMYKRAIRYRLQNSFLCGGNTHIRNYKHIISQKRYIQLDVAVCIYLKGDEMVCIKKTFWLKIIQRTWKRICLERKNIVKRTTLQVLYQREIKKRYTPIYRLKGMLSHLKNN